MKFSVELPIGTPDELMTCAGAIEAAGFDACFVTDHPVPSRAWLTTGGHETLDPFVALSFAAAATRRLRLHTNCLIPAYRNPYLAAKAVATLDACSRGRVILGVALGYLEPEFEALGVPFAERARRLDEALSAMKEAWAGEIPDNVVTPSCVQRPPPPIWRFPQSTHILSTGPVFSSKSGIERPQNAALGVFLVSVDRSACETISAAAAGSR